MVDSKDVDTLSSELESRLDDLFSETNDAQADAEDTDAAAYYPLAELKNLVLSIDWEITDDVLEKLLQQIKDLKLTYKHDKIVLTFLQILNSLGIYIQTNQAKSHPKTFKILNSVFSSLDKVVLTRDMAETAKKKILRAEMNRYKDLRNQISKGTAAAKSKVKTRPEQAEALSVTTDQPVTLTKPSVETSEPEILESPVTDHAPEPDVAAMPEAWVEALAEAVEEIKKYIRDEIGALKKEIDALRH